MSNLQKHKPAQRAANIVQTKPSTTNAKLGYLLSAQNAILDKFANKWTYVNVFDAISIPKSLEFLISSFDVVGRVNNVSAGFTRHKLVIEREDGSVFASSEVSGELNNGDVNLAFAFRVVKFDKAGRYFLRLYSNDVLLDDGDKYYINVLRST